MGINDTTHTCPCFQEFSKQEIRVRQMGDQRMKVLPPGMGTKHCHPPNMPMTHSRFSQRIPNSTHWPVHLWRACKAVDNCPLRERVREHRVPVTTCLPSCPALRGYSGHRGCGVLGSLFGVPSLLFPAGPSRPGSWKSCLCFPSRSIFCPELQIPHRESLFFFLKAPQLFS